MTVKPTTKNSSPNQIHNLSRIKSHLIQSNQKNSATSSQIIARNNSRKKLMCDYRRANSKIQSAGGFKKSKPA